MMQKVRILTHLHIHSSQTCIHVDTHSPTLEGQASRQETSDLPNEKRNNEEREKPTYSAPRHIRITHANYTGTRSAPRHSRTNTL